MAVVSSEQNFVSNSANAAKTLMILYGLLVELDALWAGSPNYSSTIDDNFLSTHGFSGLTHQTLADAEFTLATIKTNIGNQLPALSILATL